MQGEGGTWREDGKVSTRIFFAFQRSSLPFPKAHQDPLLSGKEVIPLPLSHVKQLHVCDRLLPWEVV